MTKVIPLTEAEAVALIKAATNQPARFIFGSGGVALEVDTEGPWPWELELVGRMRGVLNQGMDGEGI